MTDDGSGGGGARDEGAGDGVAADERVADAIASGSVGGEDASADDSTADEASADGSTASDASADGWTASDASADGAGVGEGAPREEMDPELEEVVEYDLEDLEDDEEVPYPSMDDPVAPQSIDLEHAAFVVLGVAATVGLVAHMVLGVL